MITPDAPETQAHTDIVTGGWIDRTLPEGARPYAYLMRLDRPIGTWLLLLPGWWGIVAASQGIAQMKLSAWMYLALFGFGAVIMRGAGCVINDLWDRNIDTQVERTKNRPLASGAVTPAQAIFFLIFLLWLGLIILVLLPAASIVIGFGAMGLVALYPLAKRFTWYPQAVLGLTFNTGALMGYAAVAHQTDTAAWLLYAGGIFWTLGYDTVYAWQDRADDVMVGIKSTAVKFGEQSPVWVYRFYALAAIFFFAAGFVLQAQPGFYLFWALAAFHLIYQFHHWALHDPQSSLAIFRSNRNTGLLILAAFLFGFLAF